VVRFTQDEQFQAMMSGNTGAIVLNPISFVALVWLNLSDRLALVFKTDNSEQKV
jgi:hypothetical protein